MVSTSQKAFCPVNSKSTLEWRSVLCTSPCLEGLQIEFKLQTKLTEVCQAQTEDINRQNLMKIKQNKLNQSVGLTLGKQAYRTLKYRRPFKDFEVDMVLLSDAKVKVGNLYHSEKYAAGTRPAFATAINERVETYFKQPLPAT